MADPTAKEARDAWWAIWRERGFSWDQLANKRAPNWFVLPDGRLTRRRPTGRSKPATLQDVWRSEEARLVDGPDKRKWTVVHVPPVWDDGSPAKSTWTEDNLADVDMALLAAAARLAPGLAEDPAQESPSKQRTTSYIRAGGIPLDGAVLSTFPDSLKNMPFIKGDHVAFTGGTTFGAELKGLHLRSPLFEKFLALEDIEATEDLRITDSLVLGGVFGDLIQAPRLTLLRLICFGEANFEDLDIREVIDLQRSRFEGIVTFTDTKTPKLQFDQSRFLYDLSIIDFAGDLSLDRCRIEEDFTLSGFSGDRLSGARLSIAGGASMKGVVTRTATDFAESSWAQSLNITRYTFANVNFEDAEFGGKVTLKGGSFSEAAEFARAHFANAAYFSGAKWTGTLDQLQGAFRETRFESFVDFRGSNFRAFSAFDGANFKSEIRFDDAVAANDKIAREVLKAARTDTQKAELEHGFRALKQTAEAARNRNLEQAFFRYELLARRSQSTTPKLERVLSWLYGVSSDYGASFIRPVICAFVLWITFVPLYLLLGKISGNPQMQDFALIGPAPHPALPDAIGMSARAMFNLFGIWGVRPPETATGPLLEIATLRDSPLAALLTRCVSSVESLFAGILLFLAALAARRRFQIN